MLQNENKIGTCQWAQWALVSEGFPLLNSPQFWVSQLMNQLAPQISPNPTPKRSEVIINRHQLDRSAKDAITLFHVTLGSAGLCWTGLSHVHWETTRHTCPLPRTPITLCQWPRTWSPPHQPELWQTFWLSCWLNSTYGPRRPVRLWQVDFEDQ